MTSLSAAQALLGCSSRPRHRVFSCESWLRAGRQVRRPVTLPLNAARCCSPAVSATRPVSSLVSTELWRQHSSSSKTQQRATRCNSIRYVASAHSPVADLAEGLEFPVQLLYLATLLGFLAVGAYLVVRQVLIRRELEEAAKTLGDRVRQKDATCEDYFELGVILLRKKLFTQATKNLEKAKKTWDGEPDELAQVHNALGFAYVNMERSELARAAYRQAVELQPGYVTAWNNLGDACEKARDFENAYKAYKEALAYAPDNKVAQARADALKNRVSSAV